MNKGITLAALGVAASLLTSLAQASDGTINFTGEILDSACTVDIGTDNTMIVDLGKVAKTAFTGVGSTASAHSFKLNLTDCPDTVTSTTVMFDGIAYAGDDTALALTADEGVATGVGVQISDAAQNVISLFTPSPSYTLVAGDNVLPFVARYIQKGAAVTAGPANSVTQFTLNYN
ncbi:fimbrial protein [Enterobacter sp. 22452]|uniref:fimbrial protein n=1 Tax=Enterobacter TaxID=547 RepID=UPI003F83BDA7